MNENQNDDLKFSPLQYDKYNLNRQSILPPIGYPPFGYGPYPYPPIIGPYPIGPYPGGPYYPPRPGGYYPGGNKKWNPSYPNYKKKGNYSKRESDNIPLYQSDDNTNEINIKEYALDSTRDIYGITLLSLTVPETIDDSITEVVGRIDNQDVYSKIPCIKYRTVNYNLLLEILFPSTLADNLKEKIIELSSLAADDAINTVTLARNDNTSTNPLDTYNELTSSIPMLLKEFSHLLKTRQSKFSQLKDLSKDISFSIRNEKITSPWTMYL